MTKIEIRCGNDWDAVIVNGETVYEGHSIPLTVWRDILKSIPDIEVDMPKGHFCEDCCEWYTGKACTCGDEE